MAIRAMWMNGLPYHTMPYCEAHYLEWRELTQGRTWSSGGWGEGPPGWEEHLYVEVRPGGAGFYFGSFYLKPL